VNETTVEAVSSGIEYKPEEGSQWNAAADEVVALNPGQNLMFRVKATSGSFRSEAFLLNVPARPATPSYTLDFVNESTVEDVPEGTQLSASPDFGVYETGNNEPMPLTPGSAHYFRVAPTESSFRSESQMLSAPPRPVLTSDQDADTISSSPFTVHADFTDPVTGFALDSLEVTNATLSNLQGAYSFDVIPDATDSEVRISIPANSVSEGNFASEELIVYYQEEVVQSYRGMQSATFRIYPNPFSDILTIANDDAAPARISVTVIDLTGRVMVQTTRELLQFSTLDLSHLDAGLYVIHVKNGDKLQVETIQKVR
jgi:hypothetical protein